jgi:hypothetical protein
MNAMRKTADRYFRDGLCLKFWMSHKNTFKGVKVCTHENN